MSRANHDDAHLRHLRDLFARDGCLPSYGQIATALGFSARNAAYKLIQRLVASGHIVKAVGGRLAPGPRFFELSLSGDTVRAGLQAEQEGTGGFHGQALHQMLVTHPSKTILVRVRGESMVGAGILNGDVAVVETGTQPVHGDFVVAEIDSFHTIKELRMTSGKPRLIAHGAQDEALEPRQSLNIIGVVRGIVRTYRPRRQAPTKLTQRRGPQ